MTAEGARAAGDGTYQKRWVEIGDPFFDQAVFQRHLVNDGEVNFSSADGNNHRPVDHDLLALAQAAIYFSSQTWKPEKDFPESLSGHLFADQWL